jgi:hypothetical protein
MRASNAWKKPLRASPLVLLASAAACCLTAAPAFAGPADVSQPAGFPLDFPYYGSVAAVPRSGVELEIRGSANLINLGKTLTTIGGYGESFDRSHGLTATGTLGGGGVGVGYNYLRSQTSSFGFYADFDWYAGSIQHDFDAGRLRFNPGNFSQFQNGVSLDPNFTATIGIRCDHQLTENLDIYGKLGLADGFFDGNLYNRGVSFGGNYTAPGFSVGGGFAYNLAAQNLGAWAPSSVFVGYTYTNYANGEFERDRDFGGSQLLKLHTQTNVISGGLSWNNLKYW